MIWPNGEAAADKISQLGQDKGGRTVPVNLNREHASDLMIPLSVQYAVMKTLPFRRRHTTISLPYQPILSQALNDR